MNLGPKIKALRLERGFTLSKLAQKAKVSAAFLSNVEHGLKKPSVITLNRISQVLSTSVSFLLESPPQNASGHKLKILREARGLSVDDLSELSKVESGDILEFEAGQLRLDPTTLESLASALNYSTIYLLESPSSGKSMGARLRLLRQKYGLTVKALADMSGISPILLNQFENDITVPLLETLEKIAGCLNTDSSYFLLEHTDSETLYFSLSHDLRNVLDDPKVQAIIRSVKDFNKDQLNYILDHINYFKTLNNL